MRGWKSEWTSGSSSTTFRLSTLENHKDFVWPLVLLVHECQTFGQKGSSANHSITPWFDWPEEKKWIRDRKRDKRILDWTISWNAQLRNTRSKEASQRKLWYTICSWIVPAIDYWHGFSKWSQWKNEWYTNSQPTSDFRSHPMHLEPPFINWIALIFMMPINSGIEWLKAHPDDFDTHSFDCKT